MARRRGRDLLSGPIEGSVAEAVRHPDQGGHLQDARAEKVRVGPQDHAQVHFVPVPQPQVHKDEEGTGEGDPQDGRLGPHQAERPRDVRGHEKGAVPEVAVRHEVRQDHLRAEEALRGGANEEEEEQLQEGEEEEQGEVLEEDQEDGEEEQVRDVRQGSREEEEVAREEVLIF